MMSNQANIQSPAQAIPMVRRSLQGDHVGTVAELPNPHRRLIEALQNGSRISTADRAVLVRHVLRYEDEQAGTPGAMDLRLPTGGGWPDAEMWARHGCQVRQGAGALRVSAETWKPDWLPDGDKKPPAADAFREKRRRHFSERAGDPFLAAMGESYETYLSLGQQASVRSTLEAPLGSTLVVNLPTGAGKSLCAHLPAALNDDRGSLTIVVVPTVALAIDQQKSVRNVVNHETAYYGGSEAKDNIRQRIREGRQRIVFTSPEGLLTGLAPAVYRAARRGYLKHFVIDEAHIVDEWGSDFRSDFQDLAGMRQGLLDVCEESFTTLLLSATFTEGALRTLRSLFGKPGPFEHVAAARLRAEPSYWVSKTGEKETRVQQVLEAIHHLPRPLILYASVRKDVRTWYKRLREAGYRRIDMMTGNSSSQHRSDVLRRWADDDTDIVVATSAFGLGIDKSDVRAVVHACLPENVNRFYQEVGRGGRDGCASVSLLVYYENPSDYGDNGRQDDLARARGINRKRILTPETAFRRWKAMFQSENRDIVFDRSRSHVRVPIVATPGLDMDNDKNKAWNVRTLILMHRAGLLTLKGEPPPNNLDEISEEERKTRLKVYSNRRLIELKMTAPLDKDAFREAIVPVRTLMQEENVQGLSDMQELVDGDECVAETLTRVYRVPRSDDLKHASPVSTPITVAPECGGCPACRTKGHWIWASPEEAVTMPNWSRDRSDLHSSLRKLFRDGPLLFAFYSEEEQGRSWSRTIKKVAERTFHRGIRRVIAPRDIAGEWRTRWRNARQRVFVDALSDEWPDPSSQLRVPELVYLPEGRDLPPWLLQKKVPRVLIVPESARHPSHPRRVLRDTCPGTAIRFFTLKTSLSL